jgi:RND family efflux transporter MFP subunit
MRKTISKMIRHGLLGVVGLGAVLATPVSAADQDKPQGPPPVPVRVAMVDQELVSAQVALIGTTEAATESTVASEASGIVSRLNVKEGNFVQKGALLARLRDRELELRLKGAIAAREKTRANLENAVRELERAQKLKDTNTIAESKYEEALYKQQALEQALLESQAEIEYLQYQIEQKKILAPFDGHVVQEHTQVGEWVSAGGPIVTLLDLSHIRIRVDVPERYVVMLQNKDKVKVAIRSLSDDFLAGKIDAVLAQGNPDARTFPVRIDLANPGMKIMSGMEAVVRFDLAEKKQTLIVPKDAIVSAGNDRMVYVVREGQAFPVIVSIEGYYDGNAGVQGALQPREQVVIRGNERLRPGQSVQIVQ